MDIDTLFTTCSCVVAGKVKKDMQPNNASHAPSPNMGPSDKQKMNAQQIAQPAMDKKGTTRKRPPPDALKSAWTTPSRLYPLGGANPLCPVHWLGCFCFVSSVCVKPSA